jgi:hypothetical protein
MRIKSITARNYKIHREVSVQCEPSCTVIGGPNECGKSTLAEAAHRAYFLKPKITGETQKGMVSFNPGGQPEVEVCFEAVARSITFQNDSAARLVRPGFRRLGERAGRMKPPRSSWPEFSEWNRLVAAEEPASAQPSSGLTFGFGSARLDTTRPSMQTTKRIHSCRGCRRPVAQRSCRRTYGSPLYVPIPLRKRCRPLRCGING